VANAVPFGEQFDAVRIGDTVRRKTGPWTPAVHALLRHLEDAGFDGAPRVVGIDDGGREVLTYVEGKIGFAPVPSSDETLAGLGRLLRRYHRAVEGFAAPCDADWQIPGTGDIICHNDLYGGNVVLRGDLPVALIDWEMAGPGTQLTDLASAACFWTPLCSDADADRRGLPRGRRGERLRLLCDAYGLSAHARGSLLDAVSAYLLRGYELHRRWGRLERRPKWRRMWESGSGDAILDNAAWLDEHRGELTRWL